MRLISKKMGKKMVADTSMFQYVLNVVFTLGTAICAFIAFVAHNLRQDTIEMKQDIRELKHVKGEVVEDITSLKVLVAGQYVSKSDYQHSDVKTNEALARIYHKLDDISDKLENVPCKVVHRGSR